ncbi:MAG: hypothetical protein AABY67_06735 [Nitrospirota bacterium]|jgi:hypothetical protein
MYGLTSEEFFMYLTIALVFVIPISVRIYRRMTIGRLKAQLRDKGQTS